MDCRFGLIYTFLTHSYDNYVAMRKSPNMCLWGQVDPRVDVRATVDIRATANNSTVAFLCTPEHFNQFKPIP